MLIGIWYGGNSGSVKKMFIETCPGIGKKAFIDLSKRATVAYPI
jgi:hypothetical protein